MSDTSNFRPLSAFEARAYAPATLGPLQLRNRIIKTATYEGMTPGGKPSQQLIDHHTQLAAGGVGMTTVAYGAVSARGRTFAEQLTVVPEVVPGLRRLTDAVHAHGARVSLQLGHCGGFSKDRTAPRPHPRGPSPGWNTYGLMQGLPRVHAMSLADIQQVIDDFATAARLAVDAGFDALELHLGHGYLLSQWLSPAVNRRTDAWGGDLDRRLRLPLAVVEAVRRAVGQDIALVAKTNLSDGFKGGLEVSEAIEIGRALERAGVDAILMSGGFVSKTPLYLLRGARPLRGMIEVEKHPLQKLAIATAGPFVMRTYPFEELFFLDQARKLRAALQLPLVLLGGIVSRQNLDQAMREGFDFVALGRALIAQPTLIQDFVAGTAERSRCTHCNECMVEMDRNGVRCVLDDAEASPELENGD